jgi:hypothetical protein
VKINSSKLICSLNAIYKNTRTFQNTISDIDEKNSNSIFEIKIDYSYIFNFLDFGEIKTIFFMAEVLSS